MGNSTEPWVQYPPKPHFPCVNDPLAPFHGIYGCPWIPATARKDLSSISSELCILTAAVVDSFQLHGEVIKENALKALVNNVKNFSCLMKLLISSLTANPGRPVIRICSADIVDRCAPAQLGGKSSTLYTSLATVTRGPTLW